jgi:putative redox protein
MSFVAESGSGHSFVMDTAVEGGGRNIGPRPMETLLSGAIACTAYDVLSHLKTNTQNIEGCKVIVNAQRATTDPKVFIRVHMHFVIEGQNIEKNLVDRAIHLSRTKYGSGYRILSLTAEMTESYEINDTQDS